MNLKYGFFSILSACLISQGCNDEPDPLKLTTTTVTEITATTARSGGFIVSGIVESCGICWSQDKAPTVDDNLTSDGLVNGVFRSELTDLKPRTLYYIRAYATNGEGTSYGDELTFYTLGQEPAVTTKFPSRITETTAVLTATVNCNYLTTDVYFDYGYDTNYGMTVPAQDSPMAGNEEIKVFAGISGLTESATYHFRVRAVNELGTSCGNDMVFSMDGAQGTVTDIDGNVYDTRVVNTQTWMTVNLRTLNLNDGTPIPNVTDPIQWEETIIPCYGWIDNDTLKKNSGAQYNWYTAETGKICPTGWHVPDKQEWELLGSEDFMEIFHELDLETNWCGFTACQYWWASNLETGGAWITGGFIYINRDPYKLTYGYLYRERKLFIRCIKDEFESAK